MRRNSLLILGIFVAILLMFNGAKRLLVFRTTSQQVEEAQARLDKLKAENEALKQKLEYTKSSQFKEEEFRDKLGLAKEGETVVILPRESGDQSQATNKGKDTPNYIKWWNLFFNS